MSTMNNFSISRRRSLVYGSATAAAMVALRVPGSVFAENDSTPIADEAPTWEVIDQQLEAVAPDAAMLTVQILDDGMETIHALRSDLVLPIGSSFKLWILGALAMQVEHGELDWEQIVEIEDRYRSVPGGDLRYVDAGTEFTLRYLAERMIQKSDNTATDHMLFLAGRENVESAMSTMGVADPAPNIPLISTRELAMLKFAYPTEKLDAYYASSVEERRRILQEEIDQIPYEALADLDQTAPLEIDRVEWFASREDLARTMEWLYRQATRPGMLPVREILSLETQLPFDGEIWPYVGFKGGSELGVLSGTWLMERSDGRVYVYSVGFQNMNGPVEPAEAIVPMGNGRDRLAITP